MIASQLVTIPLWLFNATSVWLLVSSSGDSQVRYCFLASKERICYDYFVFLCKFNYAISSFISFPYSECCRASEVFFFYLNSNFCINISANDLIFGVTISHYSFNIIIKLFHFFIICTRCWCVNIYHYN